LATVTAIAISLISLISNPEFFQLIGGTEVLPGSGQVSIFKKNLSFQIGKIS
jgi:hypothetical protein